MYCANDKCNGMRFFRAIDDDGRRLEVGKEESTYIKYLCSNCQKNEKIFSVYVFIKQDDLSGACYKFGEWPQYGPRTPSKLIALIGPDRELFLQGRRCESQGLGIGAFVYYRRVVENQKNRILDRIITVSEKLAVDEETIETLRAAQQETQFKKAVDSVRYAIPQSLLINGQNPLTLLHSALSGGLHDKTDSRCLELAHDIRVVLGELAERLGQALKDEAELNASIARLMGANQGN
jgi:hypothetical protein